MSRRARGWSTVVLFIGVLALSGCALNSNAGPAPGPTHSSTSKPPPGPPPPNDLGPERIARIVNDECPDVVTESDVRLLVQPRADAVDFFASTDQCADIPSVLRAGNGARPFVSPMQYIDGKCDAGTLFTVWAHYDDDLIFGAPTIPQALADGKCVRNLYLTGSDAGMGLDYSAGREDGLRDSYDVLLGAPRTWLNRAVTLADGIPVTISQPVGNPRITLFFLRLPDGGLSGDGFDATRRESLPKLLSGTLSELHTIDATAPVTLDDVRATVIELYNAYLPVTVLAHLPRSAMGSVGDHPDHGVTGEVVMTATDAGALDPAKVVYAQGYPSAERDENLSGDALQRKLEAFAAYAAHDAVIKCSTAETCQKRKKFGDWLQRQYLIPHTDVVRP